MKRRLFLALTLTTATSAARGQDYLREQRWKSEVLASLVVGEPVRISLSSRATFLGLYTRPRPGGPAVLLAHGAGVHPDHGVIGILRVALADHGLSTLSIQMPVLATDARAEDYLPLFPEAAARIAAAANWLKSKGHSRLVLVSHSLGSWMSQFYLDSASAAPFAAWICMGRSGDFTQPVRPIPILDVYGEHDLPMVLRYAAERRDTLEHIRGSRQVVIAGADHFYTGKETELAEALLPFIEASVARP